MTNLIRIVMLQALKFGNDKEACLKAVDIGFELSPKPNNAVYKGALRTLQMVVTRSSVSVSSVYHLDGKTFAVWGDSLAIKRGEGVEVRCVKAQDVYGQGDLVMYISHSAEISRVGNDDVMKAAGKVQYGIACS